MEALHKQVIIIYSRFFEMINAVTLLINKFSPAIPGHAISTEKNKG